MLNTPQYLCSEGIGSDYYAYMMHASCRPLTVQWFASKTKSASRFSTVGSTRKADLPTFRSTMRTASKGQFLLLVHAPPAHSHSSPTPEHPHLTHLATTRQTGVKRVHRRQGRRSGQDFVCSAYIVAGPDHAVYNASWQTYV